MDAGLVAWTFCIEDTLWTTVGSSSNVASPTRASLMSVNLSADRVGSTWIWDTRNVWCWRSHNLWVFVAVEEWVSTVSLGTAAYGVVVDHLALGVGSAGPRTGVNTLLLYTSLTELTFRREQALWSAVGRAPEIAREAGTHRARTLWSALTIWSTWVRITRVCWLLDYWFSYGETESIFAT